MHSLKLDGYVLNSTPPAEARILFQSFPEVSGAILAQSRFPRRCRMGNSLCLCDATPTIDRDDLTDGARGHPLRGLSVQYLNTEFLRVMEIDDSSDAKVYWPHSSNCFFWEFD